MNKPYFLFLILFLTCTGLAAQQSRASAAIDKNSILIGEPMQLTLQASFSKAHAPVFFTIDSLLHFEILQKSKIDTQVVSNQTILRQTITLTSWDSGAWQIPAFSLPTAKITSKPLPVAVAYLPVPPNQEYHDVKHIIDVPRPGRTTWYWYLVGAALVLLLVWLLFPKKKKESATDPVTVKEGAYKKALKELENLNATTALDDKDYFTRLVAIFRTYLEQGQGIHSQQQTTGELSRQLQQLQLPHEDLKKLTATLQLSDFVKFAKYTVLSDERQEAADQIRQSIMAIEQRKK